MSRSRSRRSVRGVKGSTLAVPVAIARQRNVWIDLLLYPTHTLPTAAAPAFVAAGLALHDRVFHALPLLAGFVASWLIHVGGVFNDNYRLLRDHPDVPEHPELLDALRDGTLTLRGLATAIVACFTGAAAIGGYVVAVAGAPAVLLGIVGTVASLGYVSTRFAWTKLGIADAVFFAMFGIVAPAGAYYVQALNVSWQALVAGLPAGAIVTAVLVIDDTRDRAFDRRKGWQTTPLRFGLRGMRRWFVTLMLFAYAVPAVFWLVLGYSAWVLLPWLTAPIAYGITRTMCKHTAFEALFPLTPKTSMLACAFGLLFGAGLALRG